jgi:gamma-glutamyl hydrolase
VIGILSQSLEDSFKSDARFEGKSSYIMAAYVRFMESSGARVVPIIYDEPFDVIQKKLS